MGEGAGYDELSGGPSLWKQAEQEFRPAWYTPKACLNTTAATADNNPSSKSGFLLRSEKTGTGYRQEQAF